MSTKDILNAFTRYRKLSDKSLVKKKYLKDFEKKMIYRTTKTENPEITMKMVEKILAK